MARRKTNAELEVRAAFEASRIAPQCLADAYERLVTVLRRPMRSTVVSEPPLGPGVAPNPSRRRVERG
jgi:hypothetical protein